MSTLLSSWLFETQKQSSATCPDDNPVVILEIQPASHTPVQFEGTEFIRVGSYKKKLREFPEKERELWRIFDQKPYEMQAAAENVEASEVLKLLDYPSYFDLINKPLPETRQAIWDTLASDQLIEKSDTGNWTINNLGAILFAKQLGSFRHLGRKAVRLVLYQGHNRYTTVRELEERRGYAVGFEGLIDTLKTLLPSNEEIGKALRKEVPMYPELALRELVANAIIHQDFNITGAGPMIEVFAQRIEITNPGAPLISTDRFLDSPPRSRNESLASLMRRLGFCEERGSACYLHAVLRYLNREPMNNTSLRERFGIESKNSAMISRIMKQALESNVIRTYDESAGNKAKRYVPWWA